MKLVTILSLALTLAVPSALAQRPTPAPPFDINHFLGVWYEQAHLPNKPERRCVSDAIVLYSLDDRPTRFQLVTSCIWKSGISDSGNKTAKLSPTRDGRIRLASIWPYWNFWPFTHKYWVLALGPEATIDNEPEYEWALVGTPNHKSLWLLTRSARPNATVLDELKARASAQGYNTSRLIEVPQRREVVTASHEAEAHLTDPAQPPPASTPTPLPQK